MRSNTHSEGESDIVVMVNEYGLRSASLSTTDVNRIELPVAAVVALVVEVSHDGPHPREADYAREQRV